MKEIKIKVCGMKDPENIAGVIPLRPDYMGFILHEPSPRYVSLKEVVELVRDIPPQIRKTGVLVDEPLENAVRIAEKGIFDILQLHGNECPGYCRKLSGYIPIIKAFRISGSLPFNIQDYEPFCSMFLFDTHGDKAGGTGKKFDHGILTGYDLTTKFILSGGISVNDASSLRSYPDKMAGVDLNSRFEVAAGIKNVNMLKKFIERIRKNDDND